MTQPPPLERPRKPEPPLPSRGFLGPQTTEPDAKKRRIRWPKEAPTIKEEKAREIAKWQVIVNMVGEEHSGLVKQMTAASSDETKRLTVDRTFHNSSPSTLSRHAGAVFLYIRWCHGTRTPPFPLQEEVLFEYVCFLEAAKSPPTRADTFIKAAKFATDLLGLFSGYELFESRRLVGAVDVNLDRKAWTVQAPPLTVADVKALEGIVMDENVSSSARIVAGFALFTTGCRARLGDAVRVVVEPVIEPAAVFEAGQGHGFIEAEGTVTKTNQTRERKKWKVPLVCHSWGLTMLKWGPMWLKLRQTKGYNAAADGTLMLGCGPDWTLVQGTRMTSDTMTLLLRELLAPRRPDAQIAKITSHSMKTTYLSWACKIGIDDEIRRALGGHKKPGDDMVRLYGRDFLAEPLRQLAHVLLYVADGDFDPDQTRSGRWLREPTTKVVTDQVAHSARLEAGLARRDLPVADAVVDPRSSPELAEGGPPARTEEPASEDEFPDSDTSDDEPVPPAIRARTEDVQEAGAVVAVTHQQAEDKTTRGKLFAPEGLKVIRHFRGLRHWSKDGKILLCPSASNYPHRPENYSRAITHTDRLCGKCKAAARAELPVVDVDAYDQGKFKSQKKH